MKTDKEYVEKLRQRLTKLIDSEIKRATLPRGVSVKDGGRVMCETIFVNQIEDTLKAVREQTIADYQTEYEQKHIAEAVAIARKEEREGLVKKIKSLTLEKEAYFGEDPERKLECGRKIGYNQAIADIIKITNPTL